MRPLSKSGCCQGPKILTSVSDMLSLANVDYATDIIAARPTGNSFVDDSIAA
jgi:hypothetical protein